jgi:hypothetical protein
MSARRLVLVAIPVENAQFTEEAEGSSLLKPDEVFTPDRVEKLRKEFLRILARYEAACEKHTRLNEDAKDGKASEEEMDAFHEGEFADAEQAYNKFLEMVYRQPPEIHAAIFGW